MTIIQIGHPPPADAAPPLPPRQPARRVILYVVFWVLGVITAVNLAAVAVQNLGAIDVSLIAPWSTAILCLVGLLSNQFHRKAKK